MTIILQHQFRDLAVGERAFEIGLSFGGVGERLAVPFDAIVAFYDPAVQFGFQFEAFTETAEDATTERSDADTEESPDKRAQKSAKPLAPALSAGKTAAGKKPAALPAHETDAPPPDAGGGGEVVRLDRFRKK